MRIEFDLESLKTDEDIRQETRKHVDDFLIEMGETAAAATWDEMQRTLRSSSGKGVSFKPGSTSERAKFIRESGQEAQRTATAQDRQEAEDQIYELVKERLENGGRDA